MVVVLAAAPYLCWQLWMVLGQGPGDYPPWRVVGLVVSLAVVVVPALVLGWRTHALLVVPVSLAWAAGADWLPEDETGLAGVGVVEVAIGTVLAVAVGIAVVDVGRSCVRAVTDRLGSTDVPG